MYHILYFSGTGNTRWVANEIESQLNKLGKEVKTYSIESSVDFTAIKPDDHIIIGFPVCDSNAPYPMQKFISAMPEGESRLVSVFCTQAAASGDTGYHISEMLKVKGYMPHCIRHFRAPNNIHIPSYRFTKPLDSKDADALLEKQIPNIEKYAKEVTEKQKAIRGDYLFAHLVGGLQRAYLDKMIAKASAQMIVLNDRCINCNTCTKVCPTANITCEEGKYLFGKNCTMCMRCYSMCPTVAICFGEKNSNTEKYPRYKGYTGVFKNYKKGES